MLRPEQDAAREERIVMEIVVDAYDEGERAMGWYYYLADHLAFPFRATCVNRRISSPLRVGQEVKVTGMPPEADCEHEMLVLIEWEEEGLAVPLAQLQPLDVDEETTEAVADWHYWVGQGYQF